MSNHADTHSIEIVTFKTLPGVSVAQLLAAADATQPWLQRQPGYVTRQLLQDADEWMDIVTWASLDAAQAAGQAFMSEPSAQQFGALIDTASMVLRHATRARVWQ
jgi:hypothetical protein